MRTSLKLHKLNPPKSLSGASSGSGTPRLNSHICNVLTIPSIDASPAPSERSQGRRGSNPALGLAQQLLSFLTRAAEEPKHAEADLLTARLTPSVLADVSSHIRTASKTDVKAARLMSDLSNMAYDVSKVTASTLLHRHQLRLVSKSCFGPAATSTKAATAQAVQSNIVPFPFASDRQVMQTTMPDATKSPTSSCSVQDPLQWFVSDSIEEPLRVFAIQGSVSWDHWKINLAFEPVVFEDEDLGVQVHRGVYETALQLYDTFLPYVLQHLKAHCNPQITFTGHSLGGSVATILMLLYVSRGILPPSAISPVHTYGAPAVFCDGASAGGGHCSSCQLPCGGHSRRPWSSCAGLLAAMDLPETAVRNIVMHNDIVPRAFVCDYSQVAQLLQRWGPAFKAHVGLSPQSPHKVLYNFLGTVHILQPDRRHKFVLGDDYHHLLPAYPALYTVHRDDPCDSCSTHNAVLHFMNSPHPLSVLQSSAAYGQDGSISRYHNPDNYTKALFGLLKRW